MIWHNFDKLWPPRHLAFWLALSLPLLVLGYALLAHWRRRVAEQIGHLPQLARMTASVSGNKRLAKAILVVTAAILGFLAFLRPQTEGKAKWAKKVGLDMVLVVDFSKSMYARDIPRSRIDKAKAELDRFLDGLDGDRVGMVAFAGTVKELPLTTDYSAIKLFYRDLTPNDMPVGGTAIGMAVASAVRMLQRSRKGTKQRAQVIILLTDGEDTTSNPIDAAKMARKLGIKVYALGIGSRSGDLVPLITEDGTETGKVTDSNNRPLVSKLDEKTLVRMAEMTGGSYFRASPADFGLGKIAKAMKDLKRAETRARVQRRRIEQYHWFLWPALLLLLVDLVIGERKRRRGPVERGAES